MVSVEELMDIYGNNYYIHEENCRQQLYEEEGHKQKYRIKNLWLS